MACPAAGDAHLLGRQRRPGPGGRARSYGVRLRDATNYSGYDLCDNSNCQNYRGMAPETANGNAAVKATARADRDLPRCGGPDPVRTPPTAATPPRAAIPT